MAYKTVNGKTIKMTEEEVIAFEESRKPRLEDLKASKINKLKAYLTNTDWYGARSLDTGEYYPQEIKDKRILARQKINEIEAYDINANEIDAIEKLNKIEVI